MDFKGIDIPLAERLIVSYDPNPPQEVLTNPRKLVRWVRKDLLSFAASIQGTGVIIKLNAVVRLLGYGIILELHKLGLKVFCDLKIEDIGRTLARDGLFLNAFKPSIVTVMASADLGIRKLKDALPDTEVFVVPVLTTFEEENRLAIYGNPEERIPDTTKRLLARGLSFGADGFICAPAEVGSLRKEFGYSVTINTPNVRPPYLPVKNDDQNAARGATVARAIEIGADRVILGSPIMDAPNRLTATRMVLADIGEALGLR